jgi:addiction module RelE/StbE family toxin
MKLSYTRRAKTDLSEIFDYVAKDNTHVAARIITKIRNSLAGLTANPSLGRPGRVDGTRVLVITHTPYIVAYRIHGNEVQALAVIHAARLWPDTL